MKLRKYKRVIAFIIVVVMLLTTTTACEIRVPEEPQPLPTAMPAVTQTADIDDVEPTEVPIIEYNVSFSAEGGDGTMIDFECAVGEIFEVPFCGYTYSGYEFAGYWDGWKLVFPGSEYEMISQDIILLAQWTKISSSGGGGGGGGGSSSSSSSSSTPTPTTTPTPTQTPTITPVSSSVEGSSASNVSVQTSENISSIFTADELASDEEKKVELQVNTQGYLTASNTGAITTLNKDETVKWQYDGLPIYDISLTKQVGDNESQNVTDLGGENITITMDISDCLDADEDREFSMIRIHDGVATALEDIDEDDNTITFETSQFSTYQLAYKVIYNHDDDGSTSSGFVDEDGDGRDDVTGLDQYYTDPIPDGMPAPVEPDADSVDKTTTYTATLTIRCDTILDNLGDLNSELMHYFVSENGEEAVLADGVILEKHEITFYEGESVYDVLCREVETYGIHMESEFTPIYNSAYIEGIHNLYEFSCGPLSGWMYCVNGWYPNYGCSRYQLKEGDAIEWNYTCDLGADLGEDWLG